MSTKILIIDDEGNTVVPNETIRSSQIIETIAAPNHSRIQMNLNDEEYLIYTQKSSMNFWTYIWMVPCSILNHSSSSIITRMLLIHIVFFLQSLLDPISFRVRCFYRLYRYIIE